MADSPGPRIDAGMAREMLRCGVNQPSFDDLTPDDPRLEVGRVELGARRARGRCGGCAVHGADGRFRAADCLDASPAGGVACRTTDGWAVAPGGLATAGAACAAVGGTFAVPRTSPDNEALIAAKAAADIDRVWLDYRAGETGSWAPDASDAATATGVPWLRIR